MRCPKFGLHLLALLCLSIPLPAQALLVEFCIPFCGEGGDPSPKPFGPGTPAGDLATSVTTNSVPIVDPGSTTATHTGSGAFSGVRFTITGIVSSLQSATLQKIAFNPGFSVTANPGSGCNTSATNPCRIEVRATSDQFDFPAPKPIGGYPAGVYMLGSFTGPQALGVGMGDTISSTAEASGARLVTADGTTTLPVLVPVNTDVINATPGTDPGNIGASLPHTCTGQPTCKFIANAIRKGFSTSLEETVQQRCDTAEPCLTRLRTRLNIELKTAGNKVTLPMDWVTANVHPDKNPAEELIASTVASAGIFEVNSLAVGPQHFLMRATLGLGSEGSIDPVNEDVYIKVGPFSTTIVANTLGDKFKRLQDGKLFIFNGKVDGLQVNATFARDRTNFALWDVVVAVYGVRLGDLLPPPPSLTPVEIYVGGDSGKDAVTARFFGNPK